MTEAASIAIEPWAPCHRVAVGAMIVPIQREEYGIDITLADQPDLDDVAGFYRRGGGQFWVALDGERVIGTIGLRDIGGGDGALRKMFVAAGHRGADRGVAAALLRTLVAHAREHGFRAVWLGTTSAFLAAHRFYEKNGFVRLEPADLPAAFPRMSVDDRFYRLDL